ncbi:hypothetical protein ACTXT7_011452 [Hymenolepis weldensis]
MANFIGTFHVVEYFYVGGLFTQIQISLTFSGLQQMLVYDVQCLLVDFVIKMIGPETSILFFFLWSRRHTMAVNDIQ